jgi:aspartyl-tRNA(Asn)/glutamyl-tRNA(Gln) amidotransferase subunit A
MGTIDRASGETLTMRPGTSFLSIAEMGRGYREGRFSPSDVVSEALDRLTALEPVLNAFAEPMAETALAQAAQATAAFAAGRDLGPLQGIPIAIKDLIEVQGVATGYGSGAARKTAKENAALVTRLLRAGAVILGKTNLLEFAYGIAHPDIGQTNNPHDPSRTAGGSSGGSAAAVAAGIVPCAIGTDTGGSIRIPAAYCGIVGLKPSFGLVPLQGVFPLSYTLDHAGPLSRRADCAATVLAVLTDRPMALSATELRGLRIGVVQGHLPRDPAGALVLAQFHAALRLMQGLGVELIDIDLAELGGANEALVQILRPEAAVIHEDLIRKDPASYGPRTLAQIKRGFSVPASDYVKAMRVRDSLRSAVEACFAKVDLLASPSVPFTAPLKDPEIDEAGDSEILASGFANVTGHPSVSLPCGLAAGLPVGLQLTVALRRDEFLLSVCCALQAADQHFCAPPPRV